MRIALLTCLLLGGCLPHARDCAREPAVAYRPMSRQMLKELEHEKKWKPTHARP